MQNLGMAVILTLPLPLPLTLTLTLTQVGKVVRAVSKYTRYTRTVYAFGGIGGEDEYLSTAEVYDPASDSSWAQVTSLASASARVGIAAAAL